VGRGRVQAVGRGKCSAHLCRRPRASPPPRSCPRRGCRAAGYPLSVSAPLVLCPCLSAPAFPPHYPSPSHRTTYVYTTLPKCTPLPPTSVDNAHTTHPHMRIRTHTGPELTAWERSALAATRWPARAQVVEGSSLVDGDDAGVLGGVRGQTCSCARSSPPLPPFCLPSVSLLPPGATVLPIPYHAYRPLPPKNRRS